MSKDAESTEEGGKKKRGKMAIIIPVVVLVLGLGGGGYVFLSGGKKSSATPAKATTTTTTPGPIIRLDPITLNLTDGHVLKVGLALEAKSKPKDKEMAAIVTALGAEASAHASSSSSSGASSPMNGLESKALDIAITELGNRSYTQLSDPAGRAEAKEVLNKEISEAYHGDIVEVYFTNFVMS